MALHKQYEYAHELRSSSSTRRKTIGMNESFIMEFAARLAESQQSVGVFILDFARFSLINDVVGNHVGYDLLQSAKARLEAVIGNCVLAYTQDYKILLAVPESDNSGGLVGLAEKILHVCRQPWTIQRQKYFFTASIGAGIFPNDSRDVARLIQYADIARLRAKKLGGDNCQFYTENLSAQALWSLEMEQELRSALDKHELFLHYQPRVDLRRGGIASVEALARWQNRAFGVVPPETFISLAEECGLIVPLGEWVIKETCRQLRLWNKQNAYVKASINLSAGQLYHKNFLPDLLAILQHYDIAPAQLEFEVTENVVLRDLDRAIYILKAIKATGSTIAMDDFGTGQSSLTNLGKLPIDVLKIDRSFIQEMEQSAQSASIAQAIISLGHILKQKVTAEGVETERQLALLRRFECDEIQGYFFSRPLPAKETHQLLINGNEPLLRLRDQLAMDSSCL